MASKTLNEKLNNKPLDYGSILTSRLTFALTFYLLARYPGTSNRFALKPIYIKAKETKNFQELKANFKVIHRRALMQLNIVILDFGSNVKCQVLK